MNITQLPNRLTTEKSPYLLQRAHNPVMWSPWGEEAFNKAKQENKPIFRPGIAVYTAEQLMRRLAGF